MINLMYLVFIAMMALNVSSEVLDGFEIVENSLRKSTEEATKRNEDAKSDLSRAYEANPAKVKEWYEKGVEVKQRSDELYDYIDDLKLRIVQQTDGSQGDVRNIDHKDDLEAASVVMLAPVVGEGHKLRESIEAYRKDMGLLVDISKQSLFESMLTTEAVKKAGVMSTSWENAMFENMPVAAAITILTKLQNDVRYVEGEVLSTLITNVDVGDYRVNKIKAFVIPKSQIVTSGGQYQAQIVLAAVDSTKQPEYYLGSTKLKDNNISIPAGGVGERTFTGYVMAEGEKYTFEEKYSITESSATIAPLLMTFLYESIDNDMEMSMPSVPSGAVSPSISSGVVKFKEKNIWTVSDLDLQKAPEVTITLTANVRDSKLTESKVFKVRPLPDPQPYIAYKDVNGSPRKFTGGLVPKRTLIEAPGIDAAIDDGVLLVPHTVTGFTLNFIDALGNTIPLISNSREFTPQQKEKIRDLARGKRFYIGNVKALNPAGRPVSIKYSMEVIVN